MRPNFRAISPIAILVLAAMYMRRISAVQSSTINMCLNKWVLLSRDSTRPCVCAAGASNEKKKNAPPPPGARGSPRVGRGRVVGARVSRDCVWTAVYREVLLLGV